MSRIPGEERKFKRRRIVAFIPFCRRERTEADSQAEATGTAVVGVEVEVVAGVATAEGRGVAVGGGRGVLVVSITIVSVGEGPDGTVGVDVLIGEEATVRVDSNNAGVNETGTVVGLAGASVETGIRG